ncbi:MAG: hypothetical protein NTZ84_03365 [Candidatus Nealsonbacteria bacterium]|nr:hypothetical protein [Candidatus Nealsonbacteria bacterium]
MNKKNNNVVDFSKDLEYEVIKPKSDQQSPKFYVSPESPQIIKWVIKCFGGIIKNEKQAYYFILGLVAITFIITIFLIFGGTERKSPEETFAPPADAPAEEVIPPSF